MTCRIDRRLALSALLVVAALTVASAQAPAPWIGDLAPIAAQDWTYDRAAHLIERAGFGAPPDEIQRLARMTAQQAVDELVDYPSIDNSAAKPFEESGIWDADMDP